MALRRFGKGYLCKWHDMIAAVSVIEFVASVLGPCNAGANAAGGEGNDVGDAAWQKFMLKELQRTRVRALVVCP